MDFQSSKNVCAIRFDEWRGYQTWGDDGLAYRADEELRKGIEGIPCGMKDVLPILVNAWFVEHYEDST